MSIEKVTQHSWIPEDQKLYIIEFYDATSKTYVIATARYHQNSNVFEVQGLRVKADEARAIRETYQGAVR